VFVGAGLSRPRPWCCGDRFRPGLSVSLRPECPYDGAHRPVGGQRFCRDYHRRERQRQMKNDETRPSPEAACEEFFPGVW